MKDWLQENPWLGRFLMVVGGAALLSLILLFVTKSRYEKAFESFNAAASEQSQLEQLDPFPSDDNYNKMKVYVEAYRVGLDKFKEEIKAHALPPPAQLEPNEFQSRLRQAITTTTDKARTNKVKLPDSFFLGFDEFTAALPNTAAAPLLGQQLSQIQLLMDIVIDARVDSVTGFKRVPIPGESGATTTPAAAAGRKPATPAAAGQKGIERGVVDLTFSSSPSVARRVINQIANVNEQLYVIRTLYVRNEKLKGPTREAAAGGTTGATPPPNAAKQPSALNFIVGNERVEVTAKIEIVRFTN